MGELINKLYCIVLLILVKYTKNKKVSVLLNAPKTQQLHFIVTQVGPSRVTNPLKSVFALRLVPIPHLFVLHRCQEPITRSLQLLHIPVTAFSQTDLFLV